MSGIIWKSWQYFVFAIACGLLTAGSLSYMVTSEPGNPSIWQPLSHIGVVIGMLFGIAAYRQYLWTSYFNRGFKRSFNF